MGVTIKDIAALAGVSYSTVSKALNDSPLVKPKTKEKIVQLAKELGYEPNFAAQRLVLKKSKTIGLIWPTLERVAPSVLVTKINEEMKKYGYHMILSVDPIKDSLEMFKRFQVDGVILFGENGEDKVHSFSDRFPIVSYGVGKERSYPIIDVDYQGAMRIAVEYLSHLGHERIVLVGDFSPFDDRQTEKYYGFRQALLQLGLPMSEDHFVSTAGLGWYDGYIAMKQFLQSAKQLPTAIIGTSFDLSSGIIRALREANYNIPKDISVIGYDNIPQMENLEIPVTSVGVPVHMIAQAIVRTLIHSIQNKSVAREENALKPLLAERSSCASPFVAIT